MRRHKINEWISTESLALQLFIILERNAFDVRGMEEKLSCALFIYAFITIEAIFVAQISAVQSVLQAQITSMAYMFSGTQSHRNVVRVREKDERENEETKIK